MRPGLSSGERLTTEHTGLAPWGVALVRILQTIFLYGSYCQTVCRKSTPHCAVRVALADMSSHFNKSCAISRTHVSVPMALWRTIPQWRGHFVFRFGMSEFSDNFGMRCTNSMSQVSVPVVLWEFADILVLMPMVFESSASQFSL
jgi:hypothetical protein